MFGIFLTPVFFYVITGLERDAAVRLGRRARPRLVVAAAWAGSAATAGRLGCPAWAQLGRRRCVLLRRRWASSAGCRQSLRFVAIGRPGNPNARLGDQRHTMIARFFIDRPIFATVISVVIVLAGGVAVFTLPVAQYPEVTPPTVLVTAVYPGANALTVQRHRGARRSRSRSAASRA